MQEPYAYIIFRASEVKDLAVDEQQQNRRTVHDDPAVIGVSNALCVRACERDKTIDGCE